jgi:hypothetical protein
MKRCEISAQTRMPTGLGVRFKSYHLAVKHRVFRHGQLAIGVDWMEEPALNGLARFDWIGPRKLNLQTCPLGELRLSVNLQRHRFDSGSSLCCRTLLQCLCR